MSFTMKVGLSTRYDTAHHALPSPDAPTTFVWSATKLPTFTLMHDAVVFINFSASAGVFDAFYLNVASRSVLCVKASG
ncbi:hypothetical protein GALMADRAFT_772185 [Galerina marginata CBS 339.88]|uniref:Uncharacterized protein n=1 Tax=Galerina marginata (strain CBS 339.88) TaxID=685588 RepID=A0A067SM27_GALM3|nr:hypothetical protein GALMADRAFT_772185 [Galerina marginata CBS 339.88]